MVPSAPVSADVGRGGGRRPAGPFARATRWTRPVLVANLVAQVAIIVTGGAVRLTGSGLGCSTWPQCEPGAFTPILHGATSIHPFIEFGNRTLTGVLGLIAILVAVLVFTDRRRATSFRVLGLVPLIGVVLQAVLGGVTVLLDLDPAVVGLHLLLSMAIVAVSTVLLSRFDEGDARPERLVAPRTAAIAWALAPAAALVLALGVVVTGSGPHGGDTEVAYRFAVDPILIARLHSGSVWLFLGLLAALLVALFRGGAPARARRAALVLLATTAAQGLIGYVQYFTGLPEVLVALHMLGAALLTVATTWALLTLRRR
ncbi:cytochrome oxidase assembly protein [Pengzhenrongella frigida]|uniref:Cytochrome oxidase assembly protein n=1 Tax=Pengzhenrongella frigida TaxID=1259133 RepID=A0A4Q5MY38_9MICO|nr:cytochrome oxidase assembly protein [Cellulomonas sp. HLT2-17]